jgi:hypothetical protein
VLNQFLSTIFVDSDILFPPYFTLLTNKEHPMPQKNQPVQLLVLLVAFLVIVISLSSSTFAQSKPTKEEKKREKEFAKQAGEKKYGKGTIADHLDEQFKLHVGGCGFINPSRLPDNVAYVPRELLTEVRPMMESAGENLLVNGQNIFWYVYSADEIAKPLSTVDINRFLNIPDFIKSEVVAAPSRIFSSWVTVRNCSGYLRSSFGVNAALPFGAAEVALKSDGQNASSMGIIGGRFRSPFGSLITQDDPYGLLLNLELWNIYKNNPSLANSAWYMNNFEGLMYKREAGVSRDFSISSSAEGTAPLSFVNINAKLNAGIGMTSSFNVLNFLTVIVSDANNAVARKNRFSKLPTAADIAAQFKKAQLKPEGEDKPLLINRDHTHKQVIYGIPRDVCLGGWDLVEVAAGVFTSTDVRATEIPVSAENKVPGCSFAITGRPDPALFPNEATPRLQRPPVSFVATLKSRAPIPDTTIFLERKIEQSLPTSVEPQLRVITSPTVDFSSSNQDVGDGFRLSWGKIGIDFDDTNEPVNRNVGATTVPDPAIVKCGKEELNITGVATVGADKKYYLELMADRILLHSDYEVAKTDNTIQCTYATDLPVQLTRGGTSIVRRPLTLRLRFPREKKIVQPEVAPKPPDGN